MNVLILGGYGHVGSIIAETLLKRTEAVRVIIAGRRLAAAQSQAAALGERATARRIDVAALPDYDMALQDVRLAIVCFDLADPTFARACFERGIGYVDISAEQGVLANIEALDDLARQHDATALISVGLMPGISNLLAKHVIGQVGGDARRVDNAVLLGLGAAFGSASVEWSLSHMADRFDRNRLRMDMGDSFGTRSVYRFAFSDQYVIPKTLPVQRAATWACFDSALFTHLIGVIRTLRLGWLVDVPALKRLFVLSIQKLPLGSDQFVLTSAAQDSDGVQTRQAWVSGTGEAACTAYVAAEVARLMLTENHPAGVYHIEQVFDLEQFLPVLRDAGTVFTEPA